MCDDTGSMILCIGCSWSKNYPKYLQRPKSWVTFGGQGLPEFLDHLGKVPLDHYSSIVVQLPTPIRSFECKIENPAQRTRCMFKAFVESGTGQSVLLARYLDEAVQISELHPNVLFFLYNVGGYPFRHPFTFDQPGEPNIRRLFRELGLDLITLSFEGKPGYAKKEEKVDPIVRSKYMVDQIVHQGYGYEWNVEHPPDHVILDAHPNEKADRLAAKLIDKDAL